MATRNFKDFELICKCGCGMLPDMKLQCLLQILRDHCQFPLTINSCARCAKRNKLIDGAKNSWHVKGLAADIRTVGLTNKQYFRLLSGIFLYFQGVEIHSTFIHVDLRTSGYWLKF
jgi:zinc D-Ala-D-Ala carboxypeptidase